MKNNIFINRNYLKIITFFIFFIFLFIMVVPFSTANAQGVDDGISWMVANQNPSGSWGNSESTELRTTLLIATVLNTVQQKNTAYQDALTFIDGQSMQNLDYLSRKIVLYARHGADVSPMIGELMAAQNPAEDNNALWNYPEGGWGPLTGFTTNNLDTAFALRAINAAGLAGGLMVANRTIAANGTDQFEFELPDTATSLSISFTSLSGTVDFRIRQGTAPTLGDPYYAITFAPVNLSGLAVEPGINYIRIDSAAGATYAFEVSYVIESFDTRSLIAPVNYLVESQNNDGGWGLSKGADSNVYMTATVLMALGEYAGFFDLQSLIADGLTWLKGKQNPDNGFGEESSSVYETALAYVTLAASEPSSVEAQNALSFLLSKQNANGSWNEDAYDTAVSILAIYASMRDMDVDNDGIPDQFDNCPDTANADQLNFDGDFYGDVCDDDDDNDGLIDDYEIDVLGTIPLSIDSDKDGILDGDEDLDFDGRTNLQELADGTDPTETDVFLFKGLNLFGYPVVVPDGYTSYDLIVDLGDDSEVVKIQRYDKNSGTYLTTSYNAGIPEGDQYDIVTGEGYLVFMNEEKIVSFAGQISCPPYLFSPGMNLISIPCMPPGATSYDLLGQMGMDDAISSIQRYNPDNGSFETTAFYNGQPSGVEFRLINGMGYIAQVRLTSTTSSMLLPPSVWITSPEDGAIAEGPQIDVTGTVSPNAVVSVNGIPASVTDGNFIAINVPLEPGVNEITATAVSANNLSTDYTIEVTLEQSPDYSIPAGDSINDSRIFQGASELIDQAYYFTEEQINVPAFISYNTTGVARTSETDIQVSFNIAVSPSASVGMYEFQVEYGLLDEDSNPLQPLSNNVFNFRVGVVQE